MTDVAPLSHPPASEAGNYFPGSTGSSPHQLTGKNEGKTDNGESAVGELEDLLKQYTDSDKRVKIRETIRLLKQSLQEGDSTPSENQVSKVTYKSSYSTENSPHRDDFQKSPGSPVSRFPGRSTSLRGQRPSYQSSAQAVNRANSFDLSRPKDFIRPIHKVGSSPQLTKVSEAPPQAFKEYADSLNNNLSQYKPPESTPISSGFTHNKTASPFSVSPQGTYRKQSWTPPKTSTVQQKLAFSVSPLSATLRSSAEPSLRRSESTKENRSSDFQPIVVVHGNVRRSKSILGRILGQKIDAERSPFNPFQAPDQEQKTLIHTALKGESQTPDFAQKPPFYLAPRSESPTLAPRAAPRSRTPSSGEVNSASKQVPSPLKRTVQVASSKEAPIKTELFARANFRSTITSSSSSCSSSSSSSGDHVYEIAHSESDISSSGSSKLAESPTLSEILQATREQNDNETLSASHTEGQTSSIVLSIDRDQNEEFESDTVFEERHKGADTEVENNIKHQDKNQEATSEKAVEDSSGQFERKLPSRSTKSRTVLQPLQSHKVCEPETAQVFHVQVIRPIGINHVPYAPVSKSSGHTKKSESEDNKETRKSSSSSLSSISSASNSEDEILSDDEGSSTDEREMDANVKTSAKTASRRLRDRHNKPLNTGDDVKTRMQRFKGHVNGEANGTPVSKRNGTAKLAGSTGNRLDVSKYEKGVDANVKITSSAAKTTITLSTTAPKSTHRSISREERFKNGVVSESRKENMNGSISFSADGDQKTRKVSSSSSSADDGLRVRRPRRGKLSSETESGSDKLEKASCIATMEFKGLGKGSNYSSSEIVIGSKMSRERAKFATGDLNNNTKPTDGDIAPTNENVEIVIEDSLSGWSSRRRNRREKLQSSATTSSTENDRSSEESAMLGKEEENEMIKQTKAGMHVTHSSPALSEIGSLGGYTIKISSNGWNKFSTHKEEVETTAKDLENKEEERGNTERKSSRVRGRIYRSSETGSSVSSKADDATDKSPSPHDDKISTSGPDVGDAKVVMKLGSEEDDAAANENRRNQSESSILGETQNERRREETREVEEQRENKDDDGEDEDSVDVDAYEDEIETPEVVDDKEILENKIHSEEESVQIQTNGNGTQQESVYKDEPVKVEGECPEEMVHVEVETPQKRPHRRSKEERKESSADEPDSVKTTRGTSGNDAAKAEKIAEELPKRRHSHNKYSTWEVEEEKTMKVELPENVEEKKKSRKHNKEKEERNRETEKAKEELPTEVDTKPEETPNAGAEKSPKIKHISIDNVEDISELSVLEKMLEGAKEYDNRRKIRSAIRALKLVEKPKVAPKYDPRLNGSIIALNLQPTKKNERMAEDFAKKGALPWEGVRGSRFVSSKTTVTKVEKTDSGSRFSSTTTERTTRMTTGQKKIGSVFDRGGDDDDDTPKSRGSGSSRLSDFERRQAERKKELQRNRSMPAATSKDARKAFVAKLEAGAPKTQGKKVGRSPTFVVPNANNVKQLLLKWCQSKTRGYEHVDIMNFSSSWASGMAFCALVHNFFPDAFDYDTLDPKNKAENLDLAFTKAEDIGGIAPLLEVEDMLIMGNRPDSKCIFTYVQFMYNHLKKFDRPLVPIKDGEKSMAVLVKVKGESDDL